jgi:signal transduction histidine kinase
MIKRWGMLKRISRKIKKTKNYWIKNLRTDKMSFKTKFCLALSLAILSVFFVVQTLLVFKIIKYSYFYVLFDYTCIILYMPPFLLFAKDFLFEINSDKKQLLEEVLKKNTYLEHATKILRHDMHSGINTYIPRGLRSLERRLTDEAIKEYKLSMPLKLLKEGLIHSQQVYKGIYEFTNLVREESTLEILPTNIKKCLETYLKRTAYNDQVLIEELPNIYINEALFCTAIDNLIRNGLKYNDSKTKWVKIKMISEKTLAVIDNGRGMSQEQFEKMRKPYVRRKNQEESGSGLGLNICIAILDEHGFKVSVKKLENGTMIMIDIINDLSIPTETL